MCGRVALWSGTLAVREDLYLDARAARSAPISQELALNFIAQHMLGLPSHR
jgi:alkylation response protein AidB-like acyl-CoA dehydrogenase